MDTHEPNPAEPIEPNDAAHEEASRAEEARILAEEAEAAENHRKAVSLMLKQAVESACVCEYSYPHEFARAVLDGIRDSRPAPDDSRPAWRGRGRGPSPYVSALLSDIVGMAHAEGDDEGELSRAIIEAGEGIVRADYFRSVQSIASDVLDDATRAYVDGESFDADERIYESVDGSQWIIYTARAHNVLRHSDHDDAHEETFGENEPATVEQRAFCAMKEDVNDAFREAFKERFGLNDREAEYLDLSDPLDGLDADDVLEVMDGKLQEDGRSVRIEKGTEDEPVRPGFLASDCLLEFLEIGKGAAEIAGAPLKLLRGELKYFDLDDADEPARAAVAWLYLGRLPTPPASPASTEGGGA